MKATEQNLILPFLTDDVPSQYRSFTAGTWSTEIDVRDFIQKNYTPYEGDASFLEGPTDTTKLLWQEVLNLKIKEQKEGVLDADTELVSSIVSHGPGYIDKELERVVGLQTDAPLKRSLMPFGGIRMAKKALESNGFPFSEKTQEAFDAIRKTHNDGVFDGYTSDIREC